MSRKYLDEMLTSKPDAIKSLILCEKQFYPRQNDRTE